MRYHRNIRQGYDPLIVKINTRKREEGATQGVSYRAIEPILGTIPLDLEWDMLSIPCMHKDNTLFSLIGQDLTFGGGQNGSVWGKEGKLVTGLSGGPRYTFDPAEVGKYEGVYVEMESTNFLLYSEEFSNPYWFKLNMLVIPSASIAPNVEMDANLLVPEIDSNIGYIRTQPNFNENGIVSVFFKKKEYKYGLIYTTPRNPNLPGNARVSFFDLEQGQVNSVSPEVLANIDSVNNGWYRCGMTINSHTSNSTETRFYGNNIIGQGFNPLPSGESSIYMWGVSLEKGSEKTSYIKTESTPVTRPADTYALPNLISPINSYTKFFIRNGDRIAESYDPQSGQKTIYENGVQIGQEAYTSTDDFVVTSQGSDKYKCFAFKQGELTEQQLIDLTATPN